MTAQASELQPQDSEDLLDNDDQSSIGNPESPDVKSTEEAEKAVGDASSSSSSSSQSPVSSSSHSGQNLSRLMLLPQELFDEITSYLNPAHIVLLALVNKELMGRFLRQHPPLPPPPPDQQQPGQPPTPPGPAVPSSPWRALGDYIRTSDTAKGRIRGTLLSTLDLDLPDLVYCYKCRKMHDPFVTFMDPAYAPHKSRRCVDYSADHHMPPRATRKLIRTITKQRMRGDADYRHLLQQVNNTTTCYRGGRLGQTSLRMRYRGDSVLLRRQQVVASVNKTPFSLWLFNAQLDAAANRAAAQALPKVHRICNHLTWMDRYAVLLDRLLRPLCRKEQANEAHPVHTHACFSRDDPFDPAQPGSGHAIAERLRQLALASQTTTTTAPPDAVTVTDVPPPLGAVQCCDRCTTDFALDVAPLPAPFHWGFVLTTWLDLGRIDFCAKWDSHRDVRPGRDFRRPAGNAVPDICERFEDLTSWRAGPPRPAAAVHPLDLDRMRNYGWAERAAAGRDRYVAWASAHCVDPMTGRILDPDPLEDADY
ncbi:hypothetical protein DL765_003795 [Monosporascus sp. GIB2]|nr:hypothetical protein DL765_003795 [Monosporascus sp. GIB2]